MDSQSSEVRTGSDLPSEIYGTSPGHKEGLGLSPLVKDQVLPVSSLDTHMQMLPLNTLLHEGAWSDASLIQGNTNSTRQRSVCM